MLEFPVRNAVDRARGSIDFMRQAGCATAFPDRPCTCTLGEMDEGQLDRLTQAVIGMFNAMQAAYVRWPSGEPTRARSIGPLQIRRRKEFQRRPALHI